MTAAGRAQTVGSLCPLVRAKNAGPFRLTIDCFCADAAAYRRLAEALSAAVVAAAFGIAAARVRRFALEELGVLKFSLPRPCTQGAVGDRDLHGAQWALLLARLRLPAAGTPGAAAAADDAARRLATVTLLVGDYDEAIGWFAQALGFELLEDAPDPARAGKRWVRMAPPGGRGAALLLARATDAAQRSRIGGQSGGRVAFFLETDDFALSHARMRERGVRFVEAPRLEPYATVAVFEDLYGNRWDLIEPR